MTKFLQPSRSVEVSDRYHVATFRAVRELPLRPEQRAALEQWQERSQPELRPRRSETLVGGLKPATPSLAPRPRFLQVKVP